MSGPFGSSQWMYNAGGSFYDYQINDSLRFDDGSSAYLNRTPSSAGNRRTWTWSGWVKRGNLGINSFIFGCGSSGTNFAFIGFTSDNSIDIRDYQGSYTYSSKTSQVFRDTSAFYHLVLVADMNNATSTDRIKLYVNGERVTSFNSAPSPTTKDLVTNSAIQHVVGSGYYNDGSGLNSYLDGYLSDVYFIDGTALDPTSFGEEKDGTWIPKSYSGSYGTNGFHLEFNGNSNDTSGNGNNWTANNISAHDYVPDSPTNNFATFNPLMYRWASNTTTLSEGNLKSTGSSGYAFGTMNIPASDKWYFETYTVAGTSVGTVGVGDGSLLQNSSVSDVVYYFSNGNKLVNGTVTSYGASWTTGDVIGVACDADSGTVTFYKNGSSQGSISYDPSGATVFFGNWGTTGYFVLNHGQDSTFSGAITAGGNSDANGVGDFKYAPPSGYLALCTANLPEPVIGPLGDSLSDENFTIMLHTGTGSQQVVTGAGFAPDFRWTKSRGTAYSHILHDNVRGETKYLQSNNTNPENTLANMSLDSDGFTVHADDLNDPQVSWLWKAGTSFSNSAGSNGATIASSGSVNTDAGFSIVSYTGNGTSGATVGHGLSSAPDMIIVKIRSGFSGGTNWRVYHSALGAQYNLRLNDTAAAVSETNKWNDTAPTSSVFSLGNHVSVNENNATAIAYCFANTDGYLKAGSYTGNGSSNGPFVYTGFRPSWILVRSIGVSHWLMFDATRHPSNVNDSRLFANLSNAEDSAYSLDLLSNGFKLRHSGSDFNTSGGTHIYLAFAENPFKYANAR